MNMALYLDSIFYRYASAGMGCLGAAYTSATLNLNADVLTLTSPT
jgi:hypothetical protein